MGWGPGWQLFVLLLPPAVSEDFGLFGPCAYPRRFTEPSGCFAYMRAAASDPGLFWFGTALEAKCPGGAAQSPRNLTCQNPLPLEGDAADYRTLASRAFGLPGQDPAAVEDFLKDLMSPMSVVYSSPQEFASGCNTTQGGGSVVFDSHPNLAPLPSFYFRYAPRIQVPKCSAESLCTLIFVDGTFGVVHNVFPNWPRDNPQLSGYFSPGANRLEPDPYVWLVYAQAGPIDFEPPTQPSDSFEFSFSDFKTSFDLTGPIALSWLLAIQDPYTNRYLLEFETGEQSQLATCPLLLESELAKQKAQVGSDVGDCVEVESLEWWLGVRFPAPLVASRPLAVGSAGVWADPIGNLALPAEFTKQKPLVYPTARLLDPAPFDLLGKRLTMAVVRAEDFSVPRPAGQALVLLYYLEINIRLNESLPLEEGRVGNEGTVVLPYFGCDRIPLVASGNGNFYLLLYEQPGGEPIGSPDDLVTLECPFPNTQLRCRFPLTAFRDQNGLRLVGLSRWRVNPALPSPPAQFPLLIRPNFPPQTGLPGPAPSTPPPPVPPPLPIPDGRYRPRTYHRPPPQTHQRPTLRQAVQSYKAKRYRFMRSLDRIRW